MKSLLFFKAMLVGLICCLFQSTASYAQFSKLTCNSDYYRLYNDTSNNDLYLLTPSTFYKYNPATGNFNTFFTLTNVYSAPMDYDFSLNIHKGKFIYYDADYPCPLIPLCNDCGRYYLFNGTSIDSLTFCNGGSPSIYHVTNVANLGDSLVYFSTLNFVYQSNYTSAGTSQVYSMPISTTPDLIYEQIDDIKSFHGNIYIVELHVYLGYQRIFLRKFDGTNWSTVDSSTGGIIIHQGKEHLFYTLSNVDSVTQSPTDWKAVEITGSGMNILYSSNVNSRFVGGNIIGSIKGNLLVGMLERDTTGNNLFAPRGVVCKINNTGITQINIASYLNPMPVNAATYWISSNFISVSNDTVMYFVANDTTVSADSLGKGNQVWVTDGTNSGTHKLSIPGSNHNNDLYDAFYFNKSVAMCKDNVYFIFDPDSAASGLDPQCWQGDRYGHANFISSIHPDNNWYDFYRYENIASNNNMIYILADTNTLLDEVCLFRNQDCSSLSSVTEIKTVAATKVYPNPFNNQLIVHRPTAKEETLFLYDNTGKLILTKPLFSEKENIFTGNLPAGLYFYNIYGKDGVRKDWGKMVKE